MMYKIFLFFLILTFSIHADYLYTKNNRCVVNLLPYDGSKGWCYTYVDTGNNACSTRAKRTNFLEGYDFNNSICRLNSDLVYTGLDFFDYNFLMSLFATLIFTIFIAILFFLAA